MAAMLYYLFLFPLSLLPMRVLYLLSDFLRLVLYNVVGYRVKVIRKNLEKSFPDHEEDEIRTIERTFYKHLCDMIVESIKFFTISQEEAESRMSFENTEVLTQLYQEGKSVIIVGGHYGSWELYGITCAKYIPHKAFALYAPLSNAFFDRTMRKSRSRFGLNMVHMKKAGELFAKNNGQPFAVIFGSDQSPRNPKKAYWLKFLNQETGVQFGAEKYAHDYQCAVVYGEIIRLGRGRYKTRYSLICKDGAQTAHGFITQAHTKLLEQQIMAEPAYWLWSHRRWKHKRPSGVKANNGDA